MIVNTNTCLSTRSTKHVSIQAHEHLNLEVHIHLTVQLPWDLSTIIKDVSVQAFNYMNISVSKHIDISSIKCVHIWLKNKSYEGVTFNLYVAFKHERIQAFDHESI